MEEILSCLPFWEEMEETQNNLTDITGYPQDFKNLIPCIFPELSHILFKKVPCIVCKNWMLNEPF